MFERPLTVGPINFNVDRHRAADRNRASRTLKIPALRNRLAGTRHSCQHFDLIHEESFAIGPMAIESSSVTVVGRSLAFTRVTASGIRPPAAGRAKE